jgi:hypothetical protein
MAFPVSSHCKYLTDDTVDKEIGFYIDPKFQNDPPRPTNPELTISVRPEMTIYTRY